MKKTVVALFGWILVLALVVLIFRFSNVYVQSIMNMLMYNIVLVLGLNFITGLTGQMNLGTVGMLALGAYAYGILTVTAGWNPWVALFAMFAVGFAVGRLLGYPSLRLKGFYLSLTTIGFSEIIRLLITNIEPLTGGTMGFSKVRRLSVWFYESQTKSDYFYILLAFVVIATVVANRIVNSKWGRSFKAVRDNSEAAEASGIDISKLKVMAFTLAAVYAAIGGAMYAGYNTYLNPSGFTLEYSQNYVAMLMIGGIGTVPGCIIGATIVTILPELLRGFADYYWIMFCTVCIVMAILVPDGLWPLIEKVFSRLRDFIQSHKSKVA
mgnify:CR=1 FL=1